MSWREIRCLRTDLSEGNAFAVEILQKSFLEVSSAAGFLALG